MGKVEHAFEVSNAAVVSFQKLRNFPAHDKECQTARPLHGESARSVHQPLLVRAQSVRHVEAETAGDVIR